MFVDNVKIVISSGKGGAGAVSFHTEKFIIQGGPDGGDGGRGGDVWVEADKNSHTLSNFKGKKVIKAKNGAPGGGRKCYGKKGEDAVITVPPGTQIRDLETGEVLADMVEDGQRIKLLQGGKGGLGNVHFKSSTNQRPSYAQPGLPGESKEVILDLKLIADIGLVGFPNVGKSTLISTISNARPEISNYEFTTLTPKLGMVKVGDYDSFVMADIPGIIENASEGKGLGIEFLRHIERTKTLLYMIDVANYRDPYEQFLKLQKEVEKYSEKLSKREFAIALTKVDSTIPEVIEEFFEKLGVTPTDKKYGVNENYIYYFDEYNSPRFVMPISSVTNLNIESIKYALFDIVKEERQKDL